MLWHVSPVAVFVPIFVWQWGWAGGIGRFRSGAIADRADWGQCFGQSQSAEGHRP
jgi:hypothetical protein